MSGETGVMLAAVRAALEGRAETLTEAPLVRLAEHYARILDGAPEDPRTAAEIGPKLLTVLGSLGFGQPPAGRRRSESTSVDAARGGDERAEGGSDVPGGDELAELRARRAGRYGDSR